METYIGLWDCKACGKKGNLGPHTLCDGCGASRPKNVVFYLSENAEATDDETAIQQAQAGVDWVCGHCRSHNKAWEFSCKACGNPKDETSGDVQLEESDYVEPSEVVPPSPPKKPFMPVWGWVLLVVGIIGFLYYLGRPKEMIVQELTWEAQIPLQHKELKQTESWNLPAEALQVQSRQVQDGFTRQIVGHSTRTREVRVQTGNERYVCGKINKGNGYFVDKYCTRPTYGTRTERYEEPDYVNVPIYRKKYFYTVNDWVDKETINQSGRKNATETPIANPKEGDPNWRVGSPQKKYFVVLKDSKNETHRKDIPFQEWEKLQEGAKIKE